jgi:hypothetical protein
MLVSHPNPRANTSATTADPGWIDEILAENAAKKAAERAAQLLAPSQPHMQRKHLLPPLREFSNVDEYVSLLTALGQAVAAGVALHLFEPDLAKRRGNARAVTEWKAAQYRAQSKNGGLRRATALGALRSESEIVATTPTGGRSVLSRVNVGGGNDQLNVSAYTLGAFVNDGDLTEAEVIQALMDAAHTWTAPANDGDCRRTINSGLSSAAADGITRR